MTYTEKELADSVTATQTFFTKAQQLGMSAQSMARAISLTTAFFVQSNAIEGRAYGLADSISEEVEGFLKELCPNERRVP